MRPREILYYGFYCICFLGSILTGIIGGFTGTHTPPMPFVIEVFTLPLGCILFVIDALMWKSTKVHKIGLTANGSIMAIILLLVFI